MAISTSGSEISIEAEMQESAKMHNHIERIWPVVMDGDAPALEEFNAEPYADRVEFYNWLRQQCGELVDLI